MVLLVSEHQKETSQTKRIWLDWQVCYESRLLLNSLALQITIQVVCGLCDLSKNSSKPDRGNL